MKTGLHLGGNYKCGESAKRGSSAEAKLVKSHSRTIKTKSRLSASVVHCAQFFHNSGKCYRCQWWKLLEQERFKTDRHWQANSDFTPVHHINISRNSV